VLSRTTDGVDETIMQTAPGTKYCFSVVPKANATVMPTESAQLFHATLHTVAENGANPGYELGQARDVYFIVPPVVAP
jgi:hypothetical protein